MTIKKKILISFFLFLNILTVLPADSIEIVAKVNNEIITNFDVEKESKYLKILNPKLRSLDNQKIFELSKKSLIKEIIKISELEKYLNINEDNEETNFFVDQYLKDLSKKLNLNNQDELKQLLVSENNYSFKEIKEKFKIEIYEINLFMQDMKVL